MHLYFPYFFGCCRSKTNKQKNENIFMSNDNGSRMVNRKTKGSLLYTFICDICMCPLSFLDKYVESTQSQHHKSITHHICIKHKSVINSKVKCVFEISYFLVFKSHLCFVQTLFFLSLLAGYLCVYGYHRGEEERNMFFFIFYKRFVVYKSMVCIMK